MSHLSVFLIGLSIPAGDVWIEGEAASRSDVVRHSWYRSVKTDLLSGGDWLAHFGNREGTAEYRVEAPAAGRHVIWLRANPIQSALSFRIHGGPWTAVDTRSARDQVNIASDDKPDLRFVAWIRAGEVELRDGPDVIDVRFHSSNQNHGGLDCLLLTTGRFRPQGISRPGAKLGRAAAGTWAFEPDEDSFDPRAVLDLRSLNEETAGRTGWIRKTPDGSFALGSGAPVRFWAANTTVQDSDDPEDLAFHARFLAKRGVNMVRFHGALDPKGGESKLADVDARQIDRCQRLVAAMKKEGIYTTISPYWAISARARPSWGLKGHPSGNLPGLLFWDEDLQAAYKGWLRELLRRPNPHAGGLPLGKDPAVAILQIQNEDSLLFWTLDAVKGEERARLERRYGEWLRGRHGSAEKALGAWGGRAVEGDDAAGGSMKLLGLWEYRPDARGAKRARLADQARFLAETMRDFNASIVRFVREELRCPVLINAGNWRTARDELLLDAERWSYGAADVIGANRYVTGLHRNPSEPSRAGYLVQKGDLFTDESILFRPWKLPTGFKRTAGLPSIVSESAWVPPLAHQSEGSFLVAAYSSLGGVDALYWFSLGSPGWDGGLGKWRAASPSVLGGWPAAALLYRKGWLRRAEPVAHEERRLEDIFGFQPAAIVEEKAFDPNRDAGDGAAGDERRRGGRVHPLAFLVGPVEAVLGGDPARSRAADLSRWIDDTKRIVRSATGEILLDWGRGLATIDAPRAQGACGFLARAGTVELGAARIDYRGEYAAVIVVPLDDRDLKDSRKVLIQVTTTSRPYGWKEAAAEMEVEGKKVPVKRIEDTGGAPWNVAEARGAITLRNPHLRKAARLDANFLREGEVAARAEGGRITFELPPEAMYIVLE